MGLAVKRASRNERCQQTTNYAAHMTASCVELADKCM